MFSCRTPFTPPTTEEDELSILRLVRSRRVGATTFHRLLAEHGSARAALRALPDLARAAGVSDYEACPEAVAGAELAAGKRAGAQLLHHGGPGYPAALLPLADAPPVLWAMGTLELLNRPMIAVIGARNASSLGLRMARRLAADLGARGIVVVSGLARGIDAAAHDAAMDTGTIGVQAGGIDVIYPAENTELAQKMAHRGLRLAELPPGHEPRAQHFPQRNRIIAGLSRATVVVEAAARSGSLLTARLALDYGREVLAVPGHPLDARAAGCNMLIRDGAVLIRGIDDIAEALALSVTPEQPPAAAAPEAPSPRETPAAPKAPAPAADPDMLMEQVMEALGPQPMHEEDLLRSLSCEAPALTRLLVELEIEGLVERHPGGMISRL
ncbi:DNA-processing protein DprA [Paenirhodobacter sp.]|uniref:DNA-processing protein DprA n=1 Tax=Paenirhodobacter sp. TaxID=1965326 RepID=UPI003B51289D